MIKKQIARMAAVLCLLFSALTSVEAQNTTSSVVGTTSDGDDVLIGAVVRLTHVESGTTYSTITNTKGMYRFDGLMPGGPYKMEVSYVGHNKSVVNIKRLSLGEVYSCNVRLTSGNELNEVVVTGTANIRKTGSSENYSAEDIDNQPTVNRTLQDILNLSPYYTGNAAFGGRGNEQLQHRRSKLQRQYGTRP